MHLDNVVHVAHLVKHGRLVGVVLPLAVHNELVLRGGKVGKQEEITARTLHAVQHTVRAFCARGSPPTALLAALHVFMPPR